MTLRRHIADIDGGSHSTRPGRAIMTHLVGASACAVVVGGVTLATITRAQDGPESVVRDTRRFE